LLREERVVQGLLQLQAEEESRHARLHKAVLEARTREEEAVQAHQEAERQQQDLVKEQRRKFDEIESARAARIQRLKDSGALRLALGDLH